MAELEVKQGTAAETPNFVSLGGNLVADLCVAFPILLSGGVPLRIELRDTKQRCAQGPR